MDYLTTSSDYDYSAISTTDENTYCDKTSVRDFQAMYAPILYGIVCLLGALGNLLVVGIYAHFKNRLKTMTDVYLLNLAIADLLFLFTLPFWAVSANRRWLFGTGMCKLVHFIYRINFFSCMLLLTCISVDRYFAIVQAAKAQKSKVKRLLYSKLVCIGVWLLAGLLSVPEVILAKTRGDFEESSCELVYPAALSKSLKIFVSAMQVCVGFFIPFIVMAFCYSVIVKTLLQAKNFEKHKALKVIIAVVAVFVVSQLPYNSLLIVKAIDVASATITDCEIVKKIDIAHQVTQSIAYMHCCLNPILYAFIGVRFRNDLIKILRSVHYISQKKMNNFFSGPKRSSMLSETEVTGALSL